MEQSTSTLKCYFVKIDNISVKDKMKGTNVLYATSKDDLLDKICERYGFGEENKKHLQLWSGQLGTPNRIRLDELEHIPSTEDTIWIRAVAKK